MRVTLNKDVSTSYTKTAKGGYSTAEVSYNEGKKPFKLVSFSNPAVFETFKDAKAGQTFEVESIKDDSGFYKWTSAKEVAEDEIKSPTPGRKEAWTPGPDPRETPTERAARQRLIVRQSSLSNAIEWQKISGATEFSFQDTLDLANRMTAWVYEAPDLFDEPNDLTGA